VETAAREVTGRREGGPNKRFQINRDAFLFKSIENPQPADREGCMTTNRSMLQTLVRAIFILLAAGAVSFLAASGPAIGMAVADGSFQVDHSRVWGNATLFDGSIVETGHALSRLKFASGARLRLGSESRATVHQGRLVLESGIGQLESAPGFEVESRTLRISAAEPGTVARIRLDSAPKVVVAALRGSVRVTNSAGLLVASVEAGKSLDFEPQTAGASAPTRATGCLLSKSGKFIVVEQTANVMLEVEGAQLNAELGNRVEISGIADTAAPSVPGASQVVRVAGLKRVAKGGCSTVARKAGAAVSIGAAGGAAGAAASSSAAGAAGAAGAATAAGIGTGTIAVIGGVATAATVGGLAAVGGLPGQGETVPTASR
jgi:hypothetical protein